MKLPHLFSWLWLAAMFPVSGCVSWVGDGGDAFSEENIRGIIRQDSPIYFRDGKTRLGVFFGEEHRSTLTFDEIPVAWAIALVAAEDGAFWTHNGIDPKHVVRAVWANLTSGGLVAGGSTLTQQTAKNLFDRPDRSLRSKWGELLNGLRLENRFSKRDILSFYANQFHVTGNGRGLGIAARYFFDKEASELSLLESAYIAGLVKGPTNYDPFYSADPARQQKACERANQRTRYVLRRIVEEDPTRLRGPFPEKVLAALRKEAAAILKTDFSIPFKQGKFQFDSNVLVDEVAHRLEQPPFDDVLEAAGITDPAEAGLEIVTTLDQNIQIEAVYSLWHHLTELGTTLEGRPAEAFVLKGERPPKPRAQADFRTHTFARAAVTQHLEVKGTKLLEANLGGLKCLIDRVALERAATAIARGAKRGGQTKASKAQIDQLRDALKPGSVLWLSIREYPADGTPLCDLEARPQIQGAAVVVEDGQIRALVGGNDNKNFNRAEAPRQFGSTWKPLVYHAAIELGWGPTDALDNQPNAFPYGTVVYAPTSDHEPAPVVSLAWAGVNSENLASVWLLYHLTDRLDLEGMASLAQQLGLARAAHEAEAAYKKRLQSMDLRISAERIPEAVYLMARTEVLRQGAQHADDTLALRSLTYGWNVTAHRRKEPVLPMTWVEVLALAPDPSGFAGFIGDLLGTSEFDPDATVGALHWRTVRALQKAIERIQPTVGTDPFAAPLLYSFQDMRIAIGLRYVTTLAKQFGVQADIREGLPLPLGASEVSLEEATTLYDGLTTGQRWEFPGKASGKPVRSPSDPTLLISEIRDTNGKVLYRAEPRATTVTSANTAAMTVDILRNVVRHGTGRRALDAIPFDGASLPLGGKTGTTNDYRNAAFLGFVPAAGDAGFRVGVGFTVGVYVGYDDNRSMKTSAMAVAGANGALPAWIGIARGLKAAGALGRPKGTPTGGEWPILAPIGLLRLPVEPLTGLNGAGAYTLGATPLELPPVASALESNLEDNEASVPRVVPLPPPRAVTTGPHQHRGREGTTPKRPWWRRL